MSTMAAELGSSSRGSSKRRNDGDGGTSMSDASGRYLSPARAREPAVGGAEIGDSPTRFSGESSRVSAASPAAPTQDMTITELTHAYQHLAAQAGLDKQWSTRVESAITDHALWLDKHSRAGNAVAKALDDLTKAVADGAKDEQTTTTGADGASGGGAQANTTDTQLRAHVQAQYAAMGARLDTAEAALRELIGSLDTSLRAHVQESTAVTQGVVTRLSERVHLLDTAGGLTASPGLVPAEARTALANSMRKNH